MSGVWDTMFVSFTRAQTDIVVERLSWLVTFNVMLATVGVLGACQLMELPLVWIKLPAEALQLYWRISPEVGNVRAVNVFSPPAGVNFSPDWIPFTTGGVAIWSTTLIWIVSSAVCPLEFIIHLRISSPVVPEDVRTADDWSWPAISVSFRYHSNCTGWPWVTFPVSQYAVNNEFIKTGFLLTERALIRSFCE